MKISYCCLPNIGSKILSDTNKKYKGPEVQNTGNNCVSHRNNSKCPVEGNKCNLRNNIYNAKIETDSKTYNYVGMSEPPLRIRIANHTQSLKTSNNQTALSTKAKELEHKI